MVCSFTALDEYFGVFPSPLRFERFDGDIVGLAKAVDGLGFPGLPYADAVAENKVPRVRYTCSDGEASTAYTQLRLARLPEKRAFDARRGVYECLRDPAPVPEQAAPELVLFEAAALASRYDYNPLMAHVPGAVKGLDPVYQRDLLELIVTGARPDKGFEILRHSGFLDVYWPEIAELFGVQHAKDFHPEGDVWRHTMETFAHRKSPDLILSLALLLHDTGKPDAVASGGRRFDKHSELGEMAAKALLGRLGYPRNTIESVAFLVRYHMLPSAMSRVPPSSIGRILDDPLVPVLLELYRCDELSTFKGPDGYYEACAAYKAYLKNSRNPYRDSDGKRRDALHRPSPRAL